MGLAVILIMGVVITLIALYGYKVSAKTAEDYLLAGRGIGIIVMCFFITFGVLSAWALFAFPGSMYLQGPGFSYFGWGASIGYAAMLLMLGPRLVVAGRLNNVLTPVELMGERFESKGVRCVLAILLVIFLIPYIGVQPLSTGLVINAALGVPIIYGAIFMTVIMTIMVVLGGMRTVAWVNVLLGTIFIVVLVTSFFWVKSVALPGGLSEAVNTLKETNPAMLGLPGPLGIYSIGMVFGTFIAGMGTIGFPHIMLSTMGARDVKVFKWLAVIVLVMAGGLFIVITLFGSLVSPAIVPGLEGRAADSVLMVAISTYLPEWMGLAFVMAVVAASISTAAIQLMAAAAFISRDIIYIFKPDFSDIQLIVWTKFMTIGVVVASFAVSLLFTQQVGYFAVIASAGISLWLPILWLGLLWPKATKKGAIAGIVVGYGHLFLGYLYPPLHIIPFPVICIGTGMLAMIIVSLLTEQVSEETKSRFFDEVDEYLEMEK